MTIGYTHEAARWLIVMLGGIGLREVIADAVFADEELRDARIGTADEAITLLPSQQLDCLTGLRWSPP
jgi:hypothetical protein